MQDKTLTALPFEVSTSVLFPFRPWHKLFGKMENIQGLTKYWKATMAYLRWFVESAEKTRADPSVAKLMISEMRIELAKWASESGLSDLEF
jgi:hypothetical protein